LRVVVLLKYFIKLLKINFGKKGFFLLNVGFLIVQTIYGAKFPEKSLPFFALTGKFSEHQQQELIPYIGLSSRQLITLALI